MSFRSLAASLALVALAPAAAAAQFTTFVAPPERVDTIVLTDTLVVARDSAAASINNMKAWVDSAAGGAVDLRRRTEIPAAVTDTATGDVFADGAPAPNTATPLPMLLTLGVGAMGAGVVLLRRR